MMTADEIIMQMAEAERRLAPVRAVFSRAMDDLTVAVFGREVCARRARRLRRRGAYVVPALQRSSTGKQRYRWLPRVRWGIVA